MAKRPNATFIIRKDMEFPNKPWTADVSWKDGDYWTSWSSGYRTRKALVAHCKVPGKSYPIVFAAA